MKICTVACVGAGTIGSSWATLFALKDMKVHLYDRSKHSLTMALRAVNSNLNELAKHGCIEEKTIDKAKHNVFVTRNLKDSMDEVDYVQESVFESYSSKKEIFKKLDRLADYHTILASSTSGLLISRIQRVVSEPQRCIIAHPWNPVHLIPLVEIVPGKATSEITIEGTRQFMCQVGKVPVVLRREISGFIGNRLSAALWREAINLVNDGIAATADIDTVVSNGPGLRWAVIGPFMTYHLGGGQGGIRKFLDTIGKTFSSYWSDMKTWNSIPENAVKRISQDLNYISSKRKLNHLAEQRNKKIIELSKILHPKTCE